MSVAEAGSTLDDRSAFAGYAPGEEKPLGSYAAVMTVFAAGMGAALFGLNRSGKELPERFSAGDLVLIGTATHKVSRLLAKDKVTSVLRAPFTRYEQPGGPAEVEEKPRGRGLRLALGELLLCPYCLGHWVASGFTVGLVASPRATRLTASIFTAVTISDFLQIAYKAAEEKGLE